MRMRKETFLAMNEVGDVTYHCVSRVVDRSFKLGDKEKAVFVKMMRQYEEFCGVEVLAYCVMSNHFHLMVRVPKSSEEELGDEEFGKRLLALYKKPVAMEVIHLLAKHRKNHANKMARELKQRYTYRMGDISEFMKSLKQKFSRWYNKVNARTGTMWEQRYSVTLVGAGWGTKVVAAYIDLNPLRAGMVSDPAEYRYCSYGEAVSKGVKSIAARSLFSVMTSVEPGASGGKEMARDTAEAIAQYRMLLAEEGREVEGDAPLQIGESKSTRAKKAKGFSKAEVKKILKRGGKLSLSQLLRCKTRYFSAGFAVGSAEYVSGVLEFLQKNKLQFMNRKSGVSKIKQSKIDLCSLRNIKKDVIS